MLKRAFAAVLLLLGVAQAEIRYKEDLAYDLVSKYEVRRVTHCDDRLNNEIREAPPILQPIEAPLDGIAPVEDDPDRTVMTPNMWKLPPFSSLAPALPMDIPEEVRERLEADRARAPKVEVAPTFSDVVPAGFTPASVELRPRRITRKEAVRQQNFDIPTPFSVRRYQGGEGAFFQISLFGGSWYKAEKAYNSLRAAAPDRQKLEGIGKEAFLLRLLERDEPEVADDEEEKPAKPEIPLGAVDVEGQARPDLFDVARLSAAHSPVWQDIPTKIKYVKRPRFRPLEKKYVDKKGALKHEFLIMVAYFPEQALTVELALDGRLGTFQNLVQLSMGLNQKVKTL